jgi:hypothetical protein
MHVIYLCPNRHETRQKQLIARNTTKTKKCYILLEKNLYNVWVVRLRKKFSMQPSKSKNYKCEFCGSTSQKTGSLAGTAILSLLLGILLLAGLAGFLTDFIGSIDAKGELYFIYEKGDHPILQVEISLPPEIARHMVVNRVSTGWTSHLSGNTLVLTGGKLNQGETLKVDYHITRYVTPGIKELTTKAFDITGKEILGKGTITIKESLLLMIFTFLSTHTLPVAVLAGLGIGSLLIIAPHIFPFFSYNFWCGGCLNGDCKSISAGGLNANCAEGDTQQRITPTNRRRTLVTKWGLREYKEVRIIEEKCVTKVCRPLYGLSFLTECCKYTVWEETSSKTRWVEAEAPTGEVEEKGEVVIKEQRAGWYCPILIEYLEFIALMGPEGGWSAIEGMERSMPSGLFPSQRKSLKSC